MPLNVPLRLVPGRPDSHYTVHTHRAHWDAEMLCERGGLPALESAAREGVCGVADYVLVGIVESDVVVTEHPDGSADVVARVLCDSEVCAAVAERYRRDADEEVQAEAAREWAAGKIVDQDVQLLRMRGELERPMLGKTPASVGDMLAALLAA